MKPENRVLNLNLSHPWTALCGAKLNPNMVHRQNGRPSALGII
jgi:hypothetical protein